MEDLNKEIKVRIITLIYKMIIEGVGYGLVGYYYDWKLMLFILVIVWGNNIKVPDRPNKKK